jgi:hypothetical protein
LKSAFTFAEFHNHRSAYGYIAIIAIWCLNASTLGAQTSPNKRRSPAVLTRAAPEIPPGPTLAETKAWLEREIPEMSSDYIVSTSERGFRSATRYETYSVSLSDCRLTLHQAFQVGDSPRDVSTTTVTLKDVDVGALMPVEVRPLTGWTSNKPEIDVRLRAITGRGEAFTYEADGELKPTAIAGVHVREQDMALRMAKALRRAAILCGAPNQPF